MKFITIALCFQFLLSCWPKTNVIINHVEHNLTLIFNVKGYGHSANALVKRDRNLLVVGS